jgi:hypothetical protein
MFRDTARYCTTTPSQFSLEMRRTVRVERWRTFAVIIATRLKTDVRLYYLMKNDFCFHTVT